MAIHYFHCTDGVDLIVDQSGREACSLAELRGRARMVADEIKRAVPSFHEWQDWAVHVYDDRGEVDIVPFEGDRSQKTHSVKAGSTDPAHLPA